jgi:IS30 family transposase
MGRPIVANEIPLRPHILIEPFDKWALDFVGSISPMSRKKNYILVCTYFVTKWVEAKSLYQATEKSVVEFIYEDIFTHFGVPREIVTDQGAQFTSKLMKELIDKYGIKHCKSSPYHPQDNGQVESTNKVLEAILTKTIHLHHKDWADRLLEALWAYWTTWRNTTGHTPYELVFGKQILLPIEF